MRDDIVVIMVAKSEPLQKHNMTEAVCVFGVATTNDLGRWRMLA